MANRLQLLVDACDQLAENKNDEQTPTVLSEQLIGKPKESKGKAPLIPQPNGKATESKGTAQLLKPRMTGLKDGPKPGRKNTQENCNKLIVFGGVPPEISEGDNYPKPIGKPKESKGKAPLIPEPNGTAKEISDDDNDPKFDTLGRMRRPRPMMLEVTEESEALKRKFDEFKERQNLERARRGVLHTKAGSITRKILDKFPPPPTAPYNPWRESDENPIKEAWTTQELESLWIGVRKFGQKIWEAILADPSLKFSSCRSPKDLSDQWDKEMSNLLNKTTLGLNEVSPSDRDSDMASSSSRQDIDLNKACVLDSEEKDD